MDPNQPQAPPVSVYSETATFNNSAPNYQQPPQQYAPVAQSQPYQQPNQQVYAQQPVVTQQQYAPVVTQTTVVSNQFGDQPTNFVCTCGFSGQTQTKTEIGMFAWLAVLFLFIFGFWCFCWIPLVVPALHDTVHTCPQCKRVVGKKAVM